MDIGDILAQIQLQSMMGQVNSQRTISPVGITSVPQPTQPQTPFADAALQAAGGGVKGGKPAFKAKGGLDFSGNNQRTIPTLQPNPDETRTSYDTSYSPFFHYDVDNKGVMHQNPDTLWNRVITRTDSTFPDGYPNVPEPMAPDTEQVSQSVFGQPYEKLNPQQQQSLSIPLEPIGGAMNYGKQGEPKVKVNKIIQSKDVVSNRPSTPAGAGGSAMIQYDPKGAGLVATDSLGNKEPQELYGGKGFLLKMQQDWNNMNSNLPDSSPIKRNARQDMEIQGDSVKNDPMVLPEINAIHYKYNRDGKTPLMEQQKIAERIKDLHKHGTEPYRRGSIQGYKKDIGDMLQAYYFYTNRTLP